MKNAIQSVRSPLFGDIRSYSMNLRKFLKNKKYEDMRWGTCVRPPDLLSGGWQQLAELVVRAALALAFRGFTFEERPMKMRKLSQIKPGKLSHRWTQMKHRLSDAGMVDGVKNRRTASEAQAQRAFFDFPLGRVLIGLIARKAPEGWRTPKRSRVGRKAPFRSGG